MYELKVVRERRAGYGRQRRVRNSRDIYKAFREHFATLDREQFLVILLDTKNAIIGFNVVSMGTLNGSLVHPREVFKPAILGNAAAVILLHNHPSGDPAPSTEDRTITARLRQAGDILGITLLDHVIIGDGTYASFAEQQLL